MLTVRQNARSAPSLPWFHPAEAPFQRRDDVRKKMDEQNSVEYLVEAREDGHQAHLWCVGATSTALLMRCGGKSID